MTYRGRHRRRKRGRALRATLTGAALALTAAATLISTSQAANSANPGPLSQLTSADELGRFQLHETLASSATLDTLTDRMGGAVNVHTVLQSANHAMRDQADCSDSETAALPVEPTATRAYCWEDGDATTQKWLPRSVTTSGDASADGTWGPDRVILAGWTHNSGPGTASADRGLARVAFVDADDPAALTYRWVLLVVPTSDGKDFTALRSGVAGMAWYQDRLIVTARSNTGTTALYAFDMRRILRAGVIGDTVGSVENGYSAHRYRYVLPATGSYSLTGGACTTTSDDGTPCFASVSLDRSSTPPSLVAGEQTGTSGRHTRVWRYDYSTAADRAGLLAVDSHGYADATQAYETKATGVRSVLSYKPSGASRADWYVGYAPGARGAHGTLWRQDTFGSRSAECTSDETRSCWGRHATSLSYWPETGELWTLTERAAVVGGRSDISSSAIGAGTPASDRAGEPVPERVLYAVPLAAVNSSLE
ncbi:hypothetical protein OK074_1641 [Actinobacteria bacterium OK074]|nr:hypothetical protein OK074_1641 [Actinobacteria bacterium OK074]